MHFAFFYQPICKSRTYTSIIYTNIIYTKCFFDNLKSLLFHYLLSTGVFIIPKPIILNIDDEKTKQIRQAYNEFMAQKKAQP